MAIETVHEEFAGPENRLCGLEPSSDCTPWSDPGPFPPVAIPRRHVSTDNKERYP